MEIYIVSSFGRNGCLPSAPINTITDNRRNANELKRYSFLLAAFAHVHISGGKPARRHYVLLSLNSHVRFCTYKIASEWLTAVPRERVLNSANKWFHTTVPSSPATQNDLYTRTTCSLTSAWDVRFIGFKKGLMLYFRYRPSDESVFSGRRTLFH